MFAAPGALDRLKHVRRLPRGRPHQERKQRGHPQPVTNEMSSAPSCCIPSYRDEDHARAEFYAVLARLFTAPPDAALLAAARRVRDIDDEADHPVVAAWNRLVAASQAMDADAAEQEYTELFIGVGKAECNLHASYWVRDAAQRPLVAVRADLADLGLERRVAVDGVRGSPRCTVRDNAHPRRRSTRSRSRAARRAAPLLRAAPGVVGIELRKRNTAMCSCQLLCARSRIR